MKKLFLWGLTILTASFASAQDIKYVSYFPVPFALHEKIDIKTLSILGSRGGALITAGSDSNITGFFKVSEGFLAADRLYIESKDDSDPGIGDSPVNLTAGLAGATGSTPQYDSSVGAMGNIQITAFSGSSVNSLEAYNNAVITGIKWGSRGGIGINASNNINWPSQCSGFNLSWVSLKLQGTDHYRTYLTCGGSSGGGPGGCTGVCSPGDTQSCNGGGIQTCTAYCTWGPCSTIPCTAPQPVSSQSCGNCGTQTRTVQCNTLTGVWITGAWGNCTGTGVCAPGETSTSGCPANYSTTCTSSCIWDVCTCIEGTRIPYPCPVGPAGKQKCIDGEWVIIIPCANEP